MEFATDDCIVAIATPPGRGGLGVIRLSGPTALTIASRILTHSRLLAPRYATYTRVKNAATAASTDEVIATYFQAPASYTGQDVVEISAHGSPVVLHAILKQAIAAGARLAAPGEFTLRAFLNGKRDLVQAEAVADLIDAATPLQARVAFDQLEGTLTRRIAEIDAVLFDLIARLEASLDFPDEGYHFVAASDAATAVTAVIELIETLLADASRGRMIREGATVVIAGRTNVGKSSIFNVLAGSERAIVTPVAGTTRDLVTEAIDILGVPMTIVDTAGWRDTSDIVEGEGIARGEQARNVADLTLVVLDGSAEPAADDIELLKATSRQRRIVIVNKSDLTPANAVDSIAGLSACHISARTGAGFDELRAMMVTVLTDAEPLRDTALVSNTRHIELLRSAREHLCEARRAAEAGDVPEEFLLTDLQAARMKLDEVVGVRTSDDVLSHIFERFCIGK